MAATLIADIVRDMWEVAKKCSNPHQVEAFLQEKTMHPTIQKLLNLEDTIGKLRTLVVPKKEKELIQCSYCDKKFINIGSHIYHAHTCTFCKDATIRDHDAHDLVCKEYIKYKKYRKEYGIRKGWKYIDDDKYIVYDGNVFTNYFYDSAAKNFEFIGRINTDGTIDRTAIQKVNVVNESEIGQCSFCEKKYVDIKGHIRECHTCLWCNDTTIKHMDTHVATCSDYIQWDSGIQSTVQASAQSKKKKEKIPGHIKTLVWSKYIGSSVPEAKCYCCKHERVEIRSFECGHVIAEAKGGQLTLDNLRPICKGCNSSMGTMSMDEYAQKFFGWSVLHEPAAAETSGDPVASAVKDDIFDIFAAPITQTVVHVEAKKEDPFADLLG
jgi:hypothetical protein